jgi:hypothetical protein
MRLFQLAWYLASRDLLDLRPKPFVEFFRAQRGEFVGFIPGRFCVVIVPGSIGIWQRAIRLVSGQLRLAPLGVIEIVRDARGWASSLSCVSA